MCLGIPGEVVELMADRPDLAKVDVSGVRRAINIGLLEDEKVRAGRLGADPRRLRPVQDRRGGGQGRPRVPRRHRPGLRRGAGRPGRLARSNSERRPQHALRRRVPRRRARPRRWPPRSPRCASRAGSTSSWRCAAGHTHTIYKHGLEDYLPESVTLVHGPGCPVCVIPMGRVDDAIAIAEQPDVIMTSFGDMMRVPGRRRLVLRRQGPGRRHPHGLLARSTR